MHCPLVLLVRVSWWKVIKVGKRMRGSRLFEYASGNEAEYLGRILNSLFVRELHYTGVFSWKEMWGRNFEILVGRAGWEACNAKGSFAYQLGTFYRTEENHGTVWLSWSVVETCTRAMASKEQFGVQVRECYRQSYLCCCSLYVEMLLTQDVMHFLLTNDKALTDKNIKDWPDKKLRNISSVTLGHLTF